MRLIYAAALLLILAACASGPMTPQSCEAVDWRARGFEAGSKGVARAAPALHPDCEALGFAVDPRAFDDGYAAGLAAFCAPENGYALGAAGRAYQGQCARGDERWFLEAYSEGRTMYGYTAAVTEARDRLESLERAYDRDREKLAEYDRILAAADGSTPEQQANIAKMRKKAERLRRDLPRLRQDLIVAARDLDDAQRALDSYEARLDRKYYSR